jgi:molecular chaperone GrpE
MEENKNVTEESPTTEETAEKETKKKKCEKKNKEEELLARIAALEVEIKDKDDRYLRLLAEFDNFKRRSREEKDAIYEISASETVAELLPIVDNLDRASLYTEAEKVLEGLKMIDKSLKESFNKLGVTEYGEPGEIFDPNIHNAVFHIEDEAYGEGEIVEVFQKGYKKGKRIIRFAMVKTAN